jgi:hypothetical protein
MVAVGAGELDLLGFLRKVAQANEDPRTSVMFLAQMLETAPRLSRALIEARSEAETTMKSILCPI